MHLETRPYIFPRRLSREFHGQAKPRQKLASIHRQKFRQQTMHNSSQHNPQHHTFKVSDVLWQSRRLDKDVIKERQQFINHSTRVSQDTPQWFKSTFNYFKHLQHENLRKSGLLIPQQKQVDIFNRRRNTYMTIQNNRMQNIYKNQSSVIRSQNQTQRPFFSTNKSSLYSLKEKQVSPKVGSIQMRDYTIKKPLLKIGSNNYVDTYSVF